MKIIETIKGPVKYIEAFGGRAELTLEKKNSTDETDYTCEIFMKIKKFI